MSNVLLRSFVDTECYVDYWLIMFMLDDGRKAAFEKFDGQPLDTDSVMRFLENKNLEHYTFNGVKYDMCMIGLALSGADNATLKRASDDLIVNNLPYWEFGRKYACVPFETNHVDLIEVAPGMASLKIYGGRLHAERMQDLPLEPDGRVCDDSPLEVDGDVITDPVRKRAALRRYCANDLGTTRLLADGLREQVELRRAMSADLGENVLSKSDAQIAEVVLKKRVFEATGVTPRKWPIAYSRFRYEPPSYVQFASEQLRNALQLVKDADFVVKDTGHVAMPATLDNLLITIGGTSYKMGLGGLHSQESEVSHYSDENTLLRDIDVRSYYPNMILNMGMFPDAMGPHFLRAYRDILTERLEAKDRVGELMRERADLEGATAAMETRAEIEARIFAIDEEVSYQKVKDAVFKITLNGAFGKTSSKYSTLYNPKMMLYTTITGQLSILMLIEALDRYGIPVVSANTDGIVVKARRADEGKLRKIVKLWERITNLETEETDYTSIHSRDVNSYIAIKTDGKVKTKGFFAKAALQKNPQNEICVDAVIEHLTTGAKVEHVIWDCRDIRKFLTIRTVKGGAFKEGYTLGKAIRWYMAKGITGAITYGAGDKKGNMVPLTEGAKPLMTLPKEFPGDVDYDWYVKSANELLMDLGVTPRPPVVKLPRKNSKAWKEMVAQGKIDPSTNTPIV